MLKFAAVQEQNVRHPIVFGLGTTADEALSDAASWADDVSDLRVYPCTPALVEAVVTQRTGPECAIIDGVATVRD